MKPADIRKESTDKLTALLQEKRTELVEKKRSLFAGELQNPSTIKHIRRDVAAILTVLNEQKAAKKEEA